MWLGLSLLGPGIAAAADGPFTVVLGIAQDAGFPQAGCRRPCCAGAWRDSKMSRRVASLAIVDPRTKQRWLIDCTPDFKRQLRTLDALAPPTPAAREATVIGLDGILLTHAHIGHYTGLMHLGREAMGARRVPVHVMPRMRRFLVGSGPWSLLVQLNNITLRPLVDSQPVTLNDRIQVTPLLVPHRDEFSETVAFRIQGPRRRVLYLPDIDKWHRWKTPIEKLLRDVDVAYLDGTFYADGELPGRNMADIPHPFIVESVERFKTLPETERAKVRFIHLNHTNPALRDASPAVERIRAAGHHVAGQGERQGL